MARADAITLGGKDESAAAVLEVNLVLIEIRAGDFFAASHADLVGAIDATAATSVIDEEVVEAVAFMNEGGFDFGGPSQFGGLVFGVEELAGLRVELGEVESVPKRAPGHPESAVVVLKQGGIDGVEGGASFRGDDGALVLPSPLGRLWIEGFSGGKTDGGGLFPEGGHRVVEVVGVLEFDDVGSPEVSVVFGDFFFVPGGELVAFEDPCGASPAAIVLFLDEGNAVAGAEEVVFLVLGVDGGGIVDALGVATTEVLREDGLRE